MGIVKSTFERDFDFWERHNYPLIIRGPTGNHAEASSKFISALQISDLCSCRQSMYAVTLHLRSSISTSIPNLHATWQYCLSTKVYTHIPHTLVTGHAKLAQRNSCEWRSYPVIPLWPVDLSKSNYAITHGSQAVNPHNQLASYSCT